MALTCVASEPKFHYMDCVNIIEGFYRGCKGNVVAYYSGNNSDGPSYAVEVEDCKNQMFTRDFDEKSLEGCKK